MEDFKKNPLVSIVIPVYNREDFVGEAIESALAQTYDNIEIVVVDNCSTDKTWDIVLKYENSKLRAYRNETNIGPVLNWKRGIELSKGEFIKLLFSDDKISNNFIEECLNFFDDKTAFVLSPIATLRGKELSRQSFYSKNRYSSREYFYSCYILFSEEFPFSPGAALFRKIDIERSFVTNIPTMQDLEPMKNGAGIDLLIYMTIAHKYQTICVSKKSLAIFRAHANSFSCADVGIFKYYYRAMIYFLSILNERKLYIFFKLFLKTRIHVKHEYVEEEYNMIEINYSKIETLSALLYFVFYKVHYKIHKVLRIIMLRFL